MSTGGICTLYYRYQSDSNTTGIGIDNDTGIGIGPPLILGGTFHFRGNLTKQYYCTVRYDTSLTIDTLKPVDLHEIYCYTEVIIEIHRDLSNCPL